MAGKSGPDIIENGLILCLDAANKTSYPGTGTTWKDLSGNNYNGTLTNGPTFSVSNMGSIVFDGVDDYATFGTPSLFAFGTGGFTINVWFSITSIITGTSGDWVTIFSKGNYSGGDFSTLCNRSSDHVNYRTLRFYIGGGSFDTILDSPSLIANKWYNYTLTRNSTTLSSYVFGVPVNSTTNNTNISSNNTLRLARQENDEYPLPGRISLFQVYNIGFSQFDVLQNYNAIKSRFGL